MHQSFLWKVAYLSKIKFSYLLGGLFYDSKGPTEMNDIGFGNLKLSPGREQDTWKCIKRHWRGKRDRYLGRKDSKMPNSFRWPILAVIYVFPSFHITEYLAGHMISHNENNSQPPCSWCGHVTKFWPKGCRQKSNVAFPGCLFKTRTLCPLPCSLPHPLSCCHSATLLLAFWTLVVIQNGETESWKKPMEAKDSCSYITNLLYCFFWSLVQSLSCVRLFVTPRTSTPGLPVHHQLPEPTQTHVHWVSDAIQPSHPLSSSSPPALNLSQHQGLFQWVSSLHQVAKALEFQLQHQSFQWTLRTDLL